MYKKKLIVRGHPIVNYVFDNFMIPGWSYIAGSFARWAFSPLAHPVAPSDIDIFVWNMDVFGRLKARLDIKLKIRDDNPACITYLKDDKHKALPPIQLIKPRHEGNVVTEGDVETILNNFDFTVARAAIVNKSEGLVGEEFDKHEQNKEICIKNIHCPVSSTYRILKYCKKGYNISTAELAKVFVDWENRDDAYKLRLLNLLQNSDLQQDEIDELEKLLRID